MANIIKLQIIKNEHIHSLPIDLDLLQHQKMLLHTLYDRSDSKKEQDLLDGLIEMCDSIQDISIEQ